MVYVVRTPSFVSNLLFTAYNLMFLSWGTCKYGNGLLFLLKRTSCGSFAKFLYTSVFVSLVSYTQKNTWPTVIMKPAAATPAPTAPNKSPRDGFFWRCERRDLGWFDCVCTRRHATGRGVVLRHTRDVIGSKVLLGKGWFKLICFYTRANRVNRRADLDRSGDGSCDLSKRAVWAPLLALTEKSIADSLVLQGTRRRID